MRRPPVDIQMLKSVASIRETHDAPMCMQMMDYCSMGLIVASSRRCNDGPVVDQTMWLPGLSSVDVDAVAVMFEGFEDPSWPAKYDARH